MTFFVKEKILLITSILIILNVCYSYSQDKFYFDKYQIQKDSLIFYSTKITEPLKAMVVVDLIFGKNILNDEVEKLNTIDIQTIYWRDKSNKRYSYISNESQNGFLFQIVKDFLTSYYLSKQTEIILKLDENIKAPYKHLDYVSAQYFYMYIYAYPLRKNE